LQDTGLASTGQGIVASMKGVSNLPHDRSIPLTDQANEPVAPAHDPASGPWNRPIRDDNHSTGTRPVRPKHEYAPDQTGRPNRERTETMTAIYAIKREFDTNLAPQIAPVASPVRTIDKRLVHKAYDDNVLLSHVEAVHNPGEPAKVDSLGTSIRKISARLRTSMLEMAMRARMIFQRTSDRTDHFRGELCVHREHTFFFEHERAHVPGIYLIEGARQMSIAAAHMFYEVPFDVYEFVMTECSARFRNVANLVDPLIAEQTLSKHVYRKGRLLSMYGVVVIRQNNLEIASLSGTIVLLNKNQLKYLEARGDKA
jgi:hypothetical protein